MRYKLLAAILLMIICLVMPWSLRADSPTLKALIVTGQNNHNWQTSSPVLKQILEDTGLFSADIATSPGRGSDMKDFNPDFSSYNVVVLDYNGDSWNRKTKESFVDYVKNGGGVVVYHAANNAFTDWLEYNEITGLGGWGDRSEKAGPYLFWKDGKIVRDSSPGIGGYHGAQHAFLVVNRDLSHPITRGLPERWMHAKDELYSLLRGPTKNLHVLATAYSTVEQSGTGRHEPVLFTVTYGKGRIFHTVLGHTGDEIPPPSLECVGFIVTFQRGAEWAAAGKVTQEIPGDFPATTKNISAPENVRRWKGFRPPSLEKILSGISGYRFGQETQSLFELESYIRSNLHSPAALGYCEDRVLEFLASDSTLDAKQFICRQLRVMGTEKSVPQLVKMVQDEETSDMARYALEKIPGKAVDRALTDILPGAVGKVKIGIINTLGQRGEPGSAAFLAKLMNDPNAATAADAINALGSIADSFSARALSKALKGTASPPSKGSNRRWSNKKHQILLEDAYLKCAGALLSRNQLRAAAKIYKKLRKSGTSPSVKAAALSGLIACSGNEAGKIILDVLKSKETDLHSAAVCQVPRIKDKSIINALCNEFPNFSIPVQVQFISTLAGYDSPDVLVAILKAAASSDMMVRIAALKALERHGGAAAVYFLANRAAHTKGQEQKAARTSLRRLKGDDIDNTIILNLIAQRDAGIQVELLQAVGERRIYKAKRVVLSKAAYGNPACRQAALKVLRIICQPQDLPDLMAVLFKARTETDRSEAENTIAAVAAKIDVVENRAEAVLAAQQKEKDVKTRCSLLRILGKIGSNSALPAVREALKEEDGEIHDTAVRVLAEWPHPAAEDDLLRIAKSSKNRVHHVLALQGYIRLVRLSKYRSPESAARCFEDALNTAKRPEEKKIVLGALPTFASPHTLRLADTCLKDKKLEAEARIAIEKIKAELGKKK